MMDTRERRRHLWIAWRVLRIMMLTTLKKQLIKAQNDRAELEKDFMNQISMMAQENHENVETLQKQLKMMQCEKNIIKANGSFEQSEELYQLEQEVNQLERCYCCSRRRRRSAACEENECDGKGSKGCTR